METTFVFIISIVICFVAIAAYCLILLSDNKLLKAENTVLKDELKRRDDEIFDNIKENELLTAEEARKLEEENYMKAVTNVLSYVKEKCECFYEKENNVGFLLNNKAIAKLEELGYTLEKQEGFKHDTYKVSW